MSKLLGKTSGTWTFSGATFEIGANEANLFFEKLGRNLAEAMAVPDPRAKRHRREIDAVLAEDARQHPAFATARRCAALAEIEATEAGASPLLMPNGGRDVARMLRYLHQYEADRGGGRAPNQRASASAHEVFAESTIRAYERARALP